MPANASLQGKASYFILLITLTAVATGFSAAAYDFIYIKNIILTLGIILLFSFSNWYKNQIVSKESLYPLVFIVWMGISAFTGKFAYKGIAEATVFFSVYMLFFFIANFQNLNIKKLRTFVVWASVPALMIGGLQIFIPQRFGGFMLFGERIPSFLGNPNFFGAYLTAMLPLIFFEAIEAKRLYRGLLLILFLLALVCIVRTGSKASLIGVIVEIPIVLFFLLKNKKHALYVTGIIVFVAALVGVYAVLQPEKIMQNESVFFRVHTWQSTLKIIATHPLNGTGPGTFALVYPKYRSEAIVKWASEHSYETTKPENILLQTMAETGLIGLGLFLFMLFLIFKKTNSVNAAFGAGLAGLFVVNLFGVDLNYISSSMLAAIFAGAIFNTMRGEKIILKPVAKYIVSILIIGALGGILLLQINTYRSSIALAKAVTLSKKGAFIEALPYYETALKTDKFNLDARYFLANAYFDADKIQNTVKALETFNTLDKYAPDYILAHYKKAGIYVFLGDHTMAALEYEKMLSIDPYFKPALSELAWIYASDRAYPKAEQVLLGALLKYPKNPEFFNNLGNVYYLQKRFLEAFEQFKKAIALNPEADYYYNAGAVLKVLGDTHQANWYLKKAYEAAKNDALRNKIKQALK